MVQLIRLLVRVAVLLGIFRWLYRWWLGPTERTPRGKWNLHTVWGSLRSSVQSGAAFGAAYELVEGLSHAMPSIDFRSPWWLLIGLCVGKFVLEFLRRTMKNYQDRETT